MVDWLAANSALLLPALAVSSGVLLVLCIVLLVAWRKARRALGAQAFDRVEAERQRIGLELSLAEQTGRLRVVRELSEVNVGAVSAIIGNAEGAQYAGEADPGAAVRAAGVIAEAARTTLGDLRRVMTVVSDGESEATAEPEVSTDSDLFAVMRDAGLAVSFGETGERFELRPGAELAVYRILQEALDNALRHGGAGTEVVVSYSWTDEGLRVAIDDDGVRAAQRREGLDPNEESKLRDYDIDEDLSALTATVTGRGITAMRERAALFGGVFDAHPVPGVGFSVSVAFPALRFHNGIHGVNLQPSGARDGAR